MSRAAEGVLMDLATCRSGVLRILRLQEEIPVGLNLRFPINCLLLRRTDDGQKRVMKAGEFREPLNSTGNVGMVTVWGEMGREKLI